MFTRCSPEKDMSKETVQFVEMVREAHSALVAVLARRFCLVCDCETQQARDERGYRCIECGYVEVQA